MVLRISRSLSRNPAGRLTPARARATCVASPVEAGARPMYENLLADAPTDLWIGGQWHKSSDGQRFDVTRRHVPLPAADILEDAILPTVDRIAGRVRQSLQA